MISALSFFLLIMHDDVFLKKDKTMCVCVSAFKR